MLAEIFIIVIYKYVFGTTFAYMYIVFDKWVSFVFILFLVPCRCYESYIQKVQLMFSLPHVVLGSTVHETVLQSISHRVGGERG